MDGKVLNFFELHPFSWRWLFSVVVVLGGLYYIAQSIYLLCFHPLARFPGPKSWIVSRFFNGLSLRKGTFVHDLKSFHDIYGPVVRYSPNELSFIDGGAWQDIYGHHGSDKNFPRNPLWYRPAPNNAHTILSAGNDDHARIRRTLSHAFSERALKDQEHLYGAYIDMLIERITKNADGRPINMLDLFQFTTFDIAGDLEFGESFGCLESGQYHPWISVMLAHFKRLIIMGSVIMMFPFLRPLVPLLVPKKIAEQRLQRFQFSQAKVGKRLDIGDDPNRADFMSYVCRYNDEKGMTRAEIEATFDILVTAGSETTASTLAATLHFLTRHPAKFQKLKTEIRSTFNDISEINLESSARLDYLTAVIREGLRLAPPSPTMLPRIVPPSGAQVCGEWLPGGTSVGVSHFAMFHSESNFSNAGSFVPERWFDVSNKLKSESKAFMPFSYGPRNCLGRNLAWAEIRIILSKMIWSFEIVNSGPEYQWEKQLTFVMWQKEPLMVSVTPVKRQV